MNIAASVGPHLGFKPRLRAVDEGEAPLAEAVPVHGAVVLGVYEKNAGLQLSVFFCSLERDLFKFLICEIRQFLFISLAGGWRLQRYSLF